MDILEAIDLLKGALPQLGRYSFRLASRPDHRLTPQIIRFRNRIETDLKALLRVRNKALLATTNERLYRVIMQAVQASVGNSSVELAEAIVQAIRREVPFDGVGDVTYVRARVVRLPDLPLPRIFEEMTARGDSATVEEWVEHAITYPVVEVFERLAFDNPVHFRVFETYFPPQ